MRLLQNPSGQMRLQPANTSSFDPSSLNLSGWWRASYPGAAPWFGHASSGTSGSHNLVTAGADPVSGPAQNGFIPADFDGATQRLGSGVLTLGDVFHTSGPSICDGGTILMLFKSGSTLAGGGPGTPYAWPALFSPSGGVDIIISFASDGLHFNIYNAGYNEVILPCTTGAHHLASMRWDGSSVGECRLDGGAWHAIGTVESNDLTSLSWLIGANFALSALFGGDILEIMTSTSCLAHADVDNVRGYMNARYGVSV